jgi:hypothetical protein
VHSGSHAELRAGLPRRHGGLSAPHLAGDAGIDAVVFTNQPGTSDEVSRVAAQPVALNGYPRFGNPFVQAPFPSTHLHAEHHGEVLRMEFVHSE